MAAPVPGPAVPWIDADDVLKWQPDVSENPDDLPLLETAALVASGLMFELSGRQFPGEAERAVRPARQQCGCFGSMASGYGMWQWSGAAPYGWAWTNECGDKLGCGPMSKVRLAGYPITEVTEVKIGGVVLDPSGYRLDNRRDLIRMADPGPPAVDQFWPSCQNMALADDQPGTFSVAYKWGIGPPESGKAAACQLAAELYAAFAGNESKLPSGVTQVVRQGITINRVVPTADLLREGTTGLELVDFFIAEANPTKAGRRSAVYSPDLQPFAREVG